MNTFFYVFSLVLSPEMDPEVEGPLLLFTLLSQHAWQKTSYQRKSLFWLTVKKGCMPFKVVGNALGE